MKVLLGIIIFIVLFLIWVKYTERRSIFFPYKAIQETPATVGLEFKDVYFKTEDGRRLNGWFIPHKKANWTVIFAHGNGGNISHRLEKLHIFHGLGVNVFIFDYRGYGKSNGSPSESGLYKDMRAAYDYVVKQRKIDGKNIILFGESLGGAVAIDLAGKVEIRALITEDTLTCINDMAKIAYPFVSSRIINKLISTKFDSVSKIRSVTCPVLIIHSRDDEIVPFYLGEKLFNSANKPKEFLELRGSHNAVFLESRDKYVDGIKSFLHNLGREVII